MLQIHREIMVHECKKYLRRPIMGSLNDKGRQLGLFLGEEIQLVALMAL
jgi:hypothetical protein